VVHPLSADILSGVVVSQYTGLWMPFPLPEMDFVVNITWNDIVDVRLSLFHHAVQHLVIGTVLMCSKSL